MVWRKLAVALVVLVGAAAACGGNAGEEIAERILESGDNEIGDIEIDTDNDQFDMSIEGDDGETVNISGSGDDEDFSMVIEGGDGETITFGTGEIPEDMTTPIADGGDVTSTFTADGQMTVMVQYPQSMFDQLVATYDGHFTGDGVNRYESSSNTDDGNVRTVTWVSDDGNASVTVSDCYSIDSDGLDAVCVAVFEGGES